MVSTRLGDAPRIENTESTSWKPLSSSSGHALDDDDELHCERLDLVRIVQLHRFKFLNRLFNSRNQVICQCLSWCRRTGRSIGYRKLCIEYDILDCSPLRFDVFAKFKYVCEG